MIKNIGRIITSGDRIASSWARNVAEKIFGGVALKQFQNALNKAHQAAAEVAAALQTLQRARVLRDEALMELWDLVKQVKRGLLGDPDHGPNDPMVKEWGNKREVEYHSGLTRREKSEED